MEYIVDIHSYGITNVISVGWNSITQLPRPAAYSVGAGSCVHLCEEVTHASVGARQTSDCRTVATQAATQ